MINGTEQEFRAALDWIGAGYHPVSPTNFSNDTQIGLKVIKPGRAYKKNLSVQLDGLNGQILISKYFVYKRNRWMYEWK